MTLLQCPQCGTHQAKIMATSQVGCAVCYDIFQPVLDPLIWNHQEATLYPGKGPSARPASRNPRETMFKETIEQAKQNGRSEDAQLLCELLQLLGTESE